MRADDRHRPMVIRPKGPFDLRLSLEGAASFFPVERPPPTTLRTAVAAEGGTAVIEVYQSGRAHQLVRASSTPPVEKERLRATAKWLISAELDLRPFYTQAASHRVMSAIVLPLHGLKPLRPATLFEMAVIAITEQQLSLAAAYRIRARLVRRFGASLNGLWVFPSAERLAAASLKDLGACGLSERKAEYVKGFAKRLAKGGLDFETLRNQSDQRIREDLAGSRGFGEWSVQYILGRGFGRPDSLPSGDTGLQRVVGHYLADGRRLTPMELEKVLAPFRPFRGLAAYYFAVHWRLRRRLEPKIMVTRHIACAWWHGRQH